MVTFGKEHLWVEGSTELANAKNRRAEFRLMRGQVRLILDDGVIYDDSGRSLATSKSQ